MTTIPTELARRGRLADLASTARRGRAPQWRVQVALCAMTEVHRSVLTVLAAADRDAGPMRVGRSQHFALHPSQATNTLARLRRDIDAGRVVGLGAADVDLSVTQLRTDPSLWLVAVMTRVLSAQCVHTARLS